MTSGIISLAGTARVLVTWEPLTINGGGLSDGFSTANDGTMLCRNDTNGAFKWNGSRWVSLTDQQRITYPEFSGYRGLTGCNDVQVAPSNSSVIYQIFTDQFGPNNLRCGLGYVYKSTDGGSTFLPTNYPPNALIDTQSYNVNGNAIFGPNNNQYKRVQNKLGVDPANPNVVYASNPGGPPLVTKDGGATWSSVPNLPIATPVCILNAATQGAAGSGATLTGTQTLDIVGGTSTVTAQVRVTITAGGSISTTNSISVITAGSYTVLPQGMPVAVTGAGGLAGASVNVSWRGGGLGACCWSFDTNGGTTTVGGQTVTKNIYCAVELSGVWLSTDGGVSFSQIASDVGVNYPTYCAVSPPDGSTFTESAFFITDNTTLPANSVALRMCRYNKTTNTWSKGIITNTESSRLQLAAHPSIAGVICSVRPSSQAHHFNYSNDYGTTWTDYKKSPDATFNESYTASDAPWVANQNNNFGLSAAGILFRAGTNELWATAGQGIFTTTITGSAPATVTWTGKTAGLEQVVMQCLAHESGSKLLQICSDLSGFLRDTSALSTSPTNPINPAAGGLSPLLLADGFTGSIDRTNVNHMVMCGNQATICGYSTDGGTTWAQFATQPEADLPSQNVSEILISNGVILYLQCPNFASSLQQESYWSWSSDNGTTWNRLKGGTAILGTTVPSSGQTGWGSSSGHVPRTTGCVDGVNSSKFYIINDLAGQTPDCRGTYVSTDGAQTFTYLGSNTHPFSSVVVASLQAAPGVANTLFAATGSVAAAIPPVHPVSTAPFRKSTDGGATWSSVANMLEVNAFAFGKAGPSGNPTLFVAGFYKGSYGIWMSEDLGESFENMISASYGLWPINNNPVYCMGADKDVFGRCYIGLFGAGAVYSALV